MNKSEHDDAPDIPPALSADEWRNERTDWPNVVGFELRKPDELEQSHRLAITFLDAESQTRKFIELKDANEIAALISFANEVLRRFDDPRAITHEILATIRRVDRDLTAEFTDKPLYEVHDFADALESMLPPEKL